MSDITNISKKLGIYDNVYLRVVDIRTKEVVQQVKGHNAATSTILSGIAHFLCGDGTLNQAKFTLDDYVPQYMSLGTMGLCSQVADQTTGLPIGIGNKNNPSSDADKTEAIKDYMNHLPGFGADGYSNAYNNNREYFGLGLPYAFMVGDVNNDNIVNQEDIDALLQYLANPQGHKINENAADVNGDGKINAKDIRELQNMLNANPPQTPPYRPGELISKSFPRIPITYRSIIPETDTEAPKSMDLILGGMVTTNALESFMGDKDYIFVTEAGLWNNKYSNGNSVSNGLLAGYRIFPQTINQIDLDSASDTTVARYYPDFQKSILRVNKDQVVQIVWKIQLGSIEDIDIQRYIKYYFGPYWNLPADEYPVPVEDLLP